MRGSSKIILVPYSSTTGQSFFILLCSLSASTLARNHEELTKHINLDPLTQFVEPFTKYSLVETVTCLAVYHYIVYNVILHRYIVSLLVGLAVLSGGVYISLKK